MKDLVSTFIDLRKKIIEKDFSRMNDMQFSAVTTVLGPLLILAGAGSGKTTVVVNRIAALIKYGNAYNSTYVPESLSNEDIQNMQDYLNGKKNELNTFALGVFPVKPWEILAITFTNKAAEELKQRITDMIGKESDDVCAGTFHSVCARILRRFADKIGYSADFSIYDTDDQKRLIKNILEKIGIEEKMLPVKKVISNISQAKDSLISVEDFEKQNADDVRLAKIAKVYDLYQKSLVEANAMDFDDLIVNTVRLLQTNKDVLDYYQKKFKHIMVDEYQDTNYAQYVLVSLLAAKHQNICVVGDDDQSIYRFRGATIENILNFEEKYPQAKVIRLEQNYRSTSIILDAANSVISKNKARKGKNLWTDKVGGEKITVFTAADQKEEARWVVDSILDDVRNGGRFSDNAVLYRVNAQSNFLENVLARSGVAYKIVGGFRFYERKEIKDIISYLSVVNNTKDTVRLRRIINEPKRGIGSTTINSAELIASQLGVPLWEVLKQSENYPLLSKAKSKIKEFVFVIEELIKFAQTASMKDLVEKIVEKTGYANMLEAMGDDGEEKLNNIRELSTNIEMYQEERQEVSLSGFLENVALISDIDSYNQDSDAIVLMTIHSAKGLEFNNVYIVGMEEGIFPGNSSLYSTPEDIEEERRLAYVAITRAKKTLKCTKAYTRMLYGTTNRNMPSRFLEEIPPELCKFEESIMIPTGLVKPNLFAKNQIQNKSSQAWLFQQHDINSPGLQSDKPKVPYSAGQRVRHKVFGEGMILSASPMGNDTLLEIAFDKKGTKKVMANFAKLEMIE